MKKRGLDPSNPADHGKYRTERAKERRTLNKKRSQNHEDALNYRKHNGKNS